MRADADTLKHLVIRAAGGTDVGCVRERNEDAYLVDAENGIFVVADGVGGHGGGDKAGFSGMTVTGAFAGTPFFMPKEQLTNFKYVKPVTDVWSMGATFYNMLSGETPRDFPRGCDPMEVILRGEIVPLSKRAPGIPKGICAVLDKAIQASTKDRFQDAGEMLAALRKAAV